VIVFVDSFDVCDLTRSFLGRAMGNLATTYRALGRHQDALVLQEKTLEFQRRVSIGVMWLCLLIYLTYDLTRSFVGITMDNLATTYNNVGRHQDALVLQEKALEIQRCLLPENHPDIGVR
jgi:tetratricopeptide (TPR) repeat protein